MFANKMRSSLTMTGIVIGVFSIVLMLSFGNYVGQMIRAEFSSLGSNILIVISGNSSSRGAKMAMGTQPTLTLGDAEAIKKECPAVADSTPMMGGAAQVVFGNVNWTTSVTGSDVGIFNIQDLKLEIGLPFTSEDVRNSNKVCVIGNTVARKLFPGTYPVNKIIRINRVPFEVKGVLFKKGQSLTAQDQDDMIYVPITTAQKKLLGNSFPGMVHWVMVKAKGHEIMDSAEKEINNLLRQRHKTYKREKDFDVRNLANVLRIMDYMSYSLKMIFGFIAGIALLVGGIGIMNIMLVSVTERTREIGIRMAAGATPANICIQFLMEAAVLSMTGGMMGIFYGVVGCAAISKLYDMHVVTHISDIVVGFGFAGATGAIFGLYPALKASRQEPIDALRYE